MVEIKEALAALDALTIAARSLDQEFGTDRGSANLGKLRSFIESVAQEQRDWVAIEAWSASFARVVRILREGGTRLHLVILDTPLRPEQCARFACGTRTEALSKAAAWARAKMGSKT